MKNNELLLTISNFKNYGKRGGEEEKAFNTEIYLASLPILEKVAKSNRDLMKRFRYEKEDFLDVASVQAYENIKSFDPDKEGANFNGWVYRIGCNIIYQEIEKRARFQNVPLEYEDEEGNIHNILDDIAVVDGPETNYEKNYDKDIFNACIDTLNDNYKATIKCELRGLSVKQTAEILKSKPEKVSRDRYRACRQIEAKCKKNEISPDFYR